MKFTIKASEILELIWAVGITITVLWWGLVDHSFGYLWMDVLWGIFTTIYLGLTFREAYKYRQLKESN